MRVGGGGELLWTGVRIGWDWSGGWEGLHWLQSSNIFFSQIMTPFSIPFGPVCCLELIQKMRSHKYIFYYFSYLKKINIWNELLQHFVNTCSTFWVYCFNISRWSVELVFLECWISLCKMLNLIFQNVEYIRNQKQKSNYK